MSFTRAVLRSTVAAPRPAPHIAGQITPQRKRNPGSLPCPRPRGRLGVSRARFPSVAPRAVVENVPSSGDGALPEYEWTRDEVDVGGIKCLVLSPVDVNNRKGMALFLSGFAQNPTVYTDVVETCAAAGIVVLGPMTDTLSGSPEELQKRVWEEGVECMEHALSKKTSPELEKYLPRNRTEAAVVGHSIGGGLTFALAEKFPEVKFIACMAPLPGLAFKKPKGVIEGDEFGKVERKVQVFRGGLDGIASASMIEEDIVEPLRKIDRVTVEDNFRHWYLHMIYQNDVDFPLEKIVFGDSPLAVKVNLVTSWLFFFDGLGFVIGIFVLLYTAGWYFGEEWLKIVAAGVLLFGLLTAAVTLAFKLLTRNPKKVAGEVAGFLVDCF